MRPQTDLHTHTVASGHAYSTLMENLAAAAEKNLLALGISDHTPGMPGTTDLAYFYNMKVWPRSHSGVQLLCGAEANILDASGEIDLPPDLLKALDYVIASVHEGVFPTGLGARENTDAMIAAMSHPGVCAIGHPDDSRFPLEYERLAQAAAHAHIALELNNSSLSPVSYRMNGWQNATALLKACRRHGTWVLLSSDSHIAMDIGRWDRALALLDELAFPESLIVNASLESLHGFLAHRA